MEASANNRESNEEFYSIIDVTKRGDFVGCKIKLLYIALIYGFNDNINIYY